MNDERFTAEQAREALDSLDDCARMDVGVDAIGPRKVLEAFIEQAAQMMREREQPAGMMGILRQNANKEHAVVLTGWESKEELERFSKSRTGAIGEFDATSNPHKPEFQMREWEVGGAVTDEDVELAHEAYWSTQDVKGDDRPAIRAALESFAARRAAVPDGWRLVPVEPTEEMIDAAMQREDDEPLSDWGKSVAAPHEAIYKAMLAAAPEVTK